MALSKEDIGQRIKEARNIKKQKTNKNFTQEMLAKELGVSRSYLGDIEAGRTYPNYVLLTKIAEACEVPLGFFDENHPEQQKALSFFIGEIINKKRKELGISLHELSIMSDVTQEYINSIENGTVPDSTLYIKPVLKILSALDLDSNEIINETDLNMEKQDDDILTLARIAEKLTPEQRQKMVDVAKAMFPEVFKK